MTDDVVAPLEAAEAATDGDETKELPLIRVPITVFASVRAVDEVDAGFIATAAMRRAFKASSIQGHGAPLTIQVQLKGDWLPVHIHQIMETGMAAGNGYLWTTASSKAYRDFPIVDAAQPASSEATPKEAT